MNEPYLTIALLIIVVCNLGVLWLWFRQRRFLFHRLSDILHEVQSCTVYLNGRMNDQHNTTRERIAQVKTRLADEEREDQDRKRRERAKA